MFDAAPLEKGYKSVAVKPDMWQKIKRESGFCNPSFFVFGSLALVRRIVELNNSSCCSENFGNWLKQVELLEQRLFRTGSQWSFSNN